MTEQEIIKLLKTNEKGFMFLPEEVQKWAIEHLDQMLGFEYISRTFSYNPSILCDAVVYRLRGDYPETTWRK